MLLPSTLQYATRPIWRYAMTFQFEFLLRKTEMLLKKVCRSEIFDGWLEYLRWVEYFFKKLVFKVTYFSLLNLFVKVLRPYCTPKCAYYSAEYIKLSFIAVTFPCERFLKIKPICIFQCINTERNCSVSDFFIKLFIIMRYDKTDY